MTTTWILTANASEAHLYQTPRAKLFNGNNALTRVSDHQHPQSRQKDADLVADRYGRYGKKGAGPSTFDEMSDPKSREAEHFAKELVSMLDNDLSQHHFQDLIIAAPPEFHGLINKYLSNKLSAVVSLNIEKDYTKLKDRQLLSQLREYL